MVINVCKEVNHMPEQNNIQEKIDIIFDEEICNLQKNISFYYYEKTDSKGNDSGIVFPPEKDLEISLIDNAAMVWDTYTTLKKLYINIENDSISRNIFINKIKEKLETTTYRGGGRYIDGSSLAFYFLMKLGKNNDIIETLKKRNAESEIHMTRLFEDVLKFLHCEPHYFDNNILDTLDDLISQNGFINLTIIAEKFREKYNSIKYKKLKNELEKINEQINIHKEQVIDIISKFGFPPTLEKFLLEIDKTSELPDWESINSGMIGNLRAFFEELIRNIANHIKTITKADFPKTENSRIGNLRQYINKYLKLSDRDNELIDAFINILHKEGGHAFLSEKRYFLLAKNIGIEIAYFLLSKLEDLSIGKYIVKI